MLVCSTGLIGEQLDTTKMVDGVGLAVAALTAESGDAAARAIMTTDTRPKQAVAAGDGYTIGGMAKGAGMLAPGLATMLVVITTDADLESADLDAALRTATRVTFDRLDSDGCMSTNDQVTLLASGASGVTPDLASFTKRLTDVCLDLALQLQSDAEGASHDIAIETVHAASEEDAVEVSRARRAQQPLQGRGLRQRPQLGPGARGRRHHRRRLRPLRHRRHDERRAGVRRRASRTSRATSSTSRPRAVQVVIDLHAGDESATIWTNDLTHDYVHENSAYAS